MFDYGLLLLAISSISVYGMLTYKATNKTSMNVPMNHSHEFDRVQLVKRLNAEYTAYLIIWPAIFLYVSHKFQLKANALYMLPLLWPVVVYANKLYALQNENRRQSHAEAVQRRSILQQNANIVIGSIVAIALVLGYISPNPVSRKKASQIICASIILALVAITLECSSPPDHYCSHLNRNRATLWSILPWHSF